MVVIAILGKSCSGKSYFQKILVNRYRYKLLKSYTTREPRPDDEIYEYVSVEKFKELEKEGFFAETAMYVGNYYGTPKLLNSSEIFVKVIEPIGYRKLKKIFKNNIIGVYLNLPSEVIKERMIQRDGYLNNRFYEDEKLFLNVENEVDISFNNKEAVEDAETIFENLLKENNKIGKIRR